MLLDFDLDNWEFRYVREYLYGPNLYFLDLDGWCGSMCVDKKALLFGLRL